MEYVKNLFFGMLIGISNAIPGVSGGTIAVILNIYDKLLFAVSAVNIRRNLSFLIPIALGMVFGIFALSNVVTPLQESHPIILGFCFLGLIIGSIPMVYRSAISGNKKAEILDYAICLFAFAFMVALSLTPKGIEQNLTLTEYGGMDFSLAFILVVYCIVAAIVMLIPGISGSLILLMFGVYTIIMEGISNFNIQVLLPVLLGTGLGLIFGVKIIKGFLRHYHKKVYFGVLGLLCGSIFTTYPGFEAGTEGTFAIVFGLIFGVLTYRLSSKN